MNLIHIIANKIQEKGPMPFVEFMQQALYHPELGYYSGGLPKFGLKGDFVTAPELTPLFGYTVANQCQQVLINLKSPIILEFGAGSGRLCIDVLTRLEQLNSLPDAYWILEVSPALKHRQLEAFQQHIPHLVSKIRWLDKWPETPFNGILLANEVLDAMPVYRFMHDESGLLESYIALGEQKNLVEIFKPCENARLIEHAQQVLPQDIGSPYQSEANLLLPGWIAECSNMLEQGAMFVFDYGFPRHEYYHPDRRTGTLMCHYRHQAHTNPLAHPGEEDITAHVDFTHVAESALDAGLQVSGYTNQGSFLLANGLLTLLENMTDETKKIKNTQAVKQLLQESEMGELFKVMALTKKLDLPLLGFELVDRRNRL